MIKKLNLFFFSFILISGLFSSVLAENNQDLKIMPSEGNIFTLFELEVKNFKPAEDSIGVEYKFKPHDSAPVSDWRSSSHFKFKVHRKGTFRAHLYAKDSEGRVAEKTQTYKVFDELPRQTKIYISNRTPKLFEKVFFEIQIFNFSDTNKKNWEVRWDFEGDGKFDTNFQKSLKADFIYETDKSKVYPIVEIKYSNLDSEKIRGDYVFPGKDAPKTLMENSEGNFSKESFKFSEKIDFEKFKDNYVKFCEFCNPNLAQDLNGNYKSIIQCSRKNTVGQEVVFDLIVPPTIVSIRPDFQGNNSWDLGFKPKSHWWWTYKKSGDYTVKFELKDIYGKTQIISKKITIFPSNQDTLEKNISEEEKIKKDSSKKQKNKKLKSPKKKEKKIKKNNSKVRIKVKVSHKKRRVFEKFLFDASQSTGEDLKYEWKNLESKYPVVYGGKQLFYFETTGEKIITLKITDKNGATDKVEIPVTVEKAKAQKELTSPVPSLIGGTRNNIKKSGFNIKTGSNIAKPKFKTGMRAGF